MKTPQQFWTLKNVDPEVRTYFKPISKASDTLFEELPDQNGALSKTVLPSAIMMANNEVSKIGHGSYTQIFI